jgi:2-phospho-L-lactate/phosphoenolpyruvate guanylyltransferase
LQSLEEMVQSSMVVWAIVPAKPLTQAKTRLSPILKAEQRAALARNLLKRTLRILQTLKEERKLAGTLVISSDYQLLSLAEKLGAVALLQKPGETGQNENAQLNHDLRAATNWIGNNLTADQLMILPTDLPLLLPADVCELLDLAVGAEAVLAPDRLRQGTNALVLKLEVAKDFEYRFGENSCEQHLEWLAERARRYHVYYHENLAFDLDRVEDFKELPEELKKNLLQV